LAVEYEFKHFVRGRFPNRVELLLMDDLVAVDNLHDELFGLGFVHLEHLFDAHLVSLHEVFKFSLKVRELLR
jgi:hypothetical protein